MTWFSEKLTDFFVCVWAKEMPIVAFTLMSVSINSATTKAAVQG